MKKIQRYIFFFLLMFPLVVSSVSYAATYDEYKEASSGQFNGADADKRLANPDWYPKDIDEASEKTPFNIFRDILGGGIINDVKDVLNGNKFKTSGGNSYITSAIDSLYTGVVAIAEALMLVMFLLELLDKTTRNGFDLEQLLRLLIKYFVAKALIENGVEVIHSVVLIGDAMVGSVSSASLSGGVKEFFTKLTYFLVETDDIPCWVLTFLSFVPWLFVKLLNFVILAVCYGRGIEIIIRGGFAPIGCIGMVQEGFSGPGLRYMKKFFAVCIQGSVIIAILLAGNNIQGAIMDSALSEVSTSSMMGFVGAVLESIIISLTEVMVIMRSQQMANDIANA